MTLFSLLLAGEASAEDKKPAQYPKPAPLAQYRITDPKAEIALARSSAPPSISANAEVLVLGSHGYETAVKGTNGFVCIVLRSWTARFDGDPEFWNPKGRSPTCYNAPAVRSVLPHVLKRAEWVLAGASKEQMIEKTKAAYTDHTLVNPEAGAMSFMLSKKGYISDEAGGPWLPHLMFFVPNGHAAEYGADMEGSNVFGPEASPIEPTIIFVPVRRWSDGSPAPPPAELKN
jgi:hypothetical protein